MALHAEAKDYRKNRRNLFTKNNTEIQVSASITPHTPYQMNGVLKNKKGEKLFFSACHAIKRGHIR